MTLPVLHAGISSLTTVDAPKVVVSTDRPGGVTDVQMEVEGLLVRSIRSEDQCAAVSLFTNPNIMKMYGWGLVLSAAKTQARVKQWVDLWSDGNPYSALSVCSDSETESVGDKEISITRPVIGFVILSSEEGGEAEIAYLFLEHVWRKGYGSKVVGAVVNTLIPALNERLPPVRRVTQLTAQVSDQNVGSKKILEKLGFRNVDIRVEQPFTEIIVTLIFRKCLQDEGLVIRGSC